MELIEQEENLRRFREAGNEYIFERDGGTGFWSIMPSKGALPKVLDQSFTTLGYAKAALEHYLNTRPAPKAKKVDEPTE